MWPLSTGFYFPFSFQEPLGVALTEPVWISSMAAAYLLPAVQKKILSQVLNQQSDLSFDLYCNPATFYKRAESKID